MTEKQKVPGYMSGSLTGLKPEEREGVLRFYEQIAGVADKHGIDLYLPHQHSDPVRDKDLTPRQVYEMDRKRVSEAHMIVAEVSRPSHGLGGELVIAWESGVNVVMMGQEDRLRALRKNPVDSIIFENPAVQATIEYRRTDEALARLDDLLVERGEDLKTKKQFPPIPDFHTMFVKSGRKRLWTGRGG